ncbi:MAG TPA: amidohydrolase family protein [Terriglobia bacterium]|nr:amidohydrolase family protein [Terriglobia bacterium]
MILSARWLVPISSPVIEQGGVVIEGDRIIAFGRIDWVRGQFPGHPVRDFGEAAILPGFVNVHSHLELSILRGYLEGLSFWDWIRRLTWTKYQVLSREDIRVSALLGAIEAVLSGITTVGDPMDLGASLDAVIRTGLRAVLYQEVFSPDAEEAESVLAGCKEKLCSLRARILNWEGLSTEDPLDHLIGPPDIVTVGLRKHRVSLGLSPHAPYTVSAPLFKLVHLLAQAERLPICIHIAESEAESQLLESGSGPIMDAWQQRGIVWSAPQCTPVEYLHRLGVIGESTLLVHCIRLSDQDFGILRATGPSIAHCPKSNWKLRHGTADLKKLRQGGLRVGLGTDSVASNNNMDFFEEMRAAYFNPCWSTRPLVKEHAQQTETIGAADILRMATLGGAEALGLATRIGSIETDKQADLIVIDLSQIHAQPVYSPVTTLVFSSRSSDVILVMVGGEVIMEDRCLKGLNLSILREQTESIRQKLVHVA